MCRYVRSGVQDSLLMVIPRRFLGEKVLSTLVSLDTTVGESWTEGRRPKDDSGVRRTPETLEFKEMVEEVPNL